MERSQDVTPGLLAFLARSRLNIPMAAISAKEWFKTKNQKKEASGKMLSYVRESQSRIGEVEAVCCRKTLWWTRVEAVTG